MQSLELFLSTAPDAPLSRALRRGPRRGAQAYISRRSRRHGDAPFLGNTNPSARRRIIIAPFIHEDGHDLVAERAVVGHAVAVSIPPERVALFQGRPVAVLDRLVRHGSREAVVVDRPAQLREALRYTIYVDLIWELDALALALFVPQV